MGAATYRIGPSDFFSPGDLEADADTLDAQVSTLDAGLEGNETVPGALLDQWIVWLGAWRAFRDDHFGGYFSSFLSSLNDSNRDDLIRYENQYESFRAQAAGYVDVVAPVGPSSGSGDTLGKQLGAQTSGILPSTGTIIVAVIAAIVIFVLWRKA